jgi:hypothetical protein
MLNIVNAIKAWGRRRSNAESNAAAHTPATIDSRELREQIESVVAKSVEELSYAGADITQVLLREGCRVVRFNRHYFVIDGDNVIEENDDPRIFDLLDKHGFDQYGDSLKTLLWDYGTCEVHAVAMDVRDLVSEAGLDPALLLPECRSLEEEITVISRLYRELGPDFFQLEPESREEYTDYIRPWQPATVRD